MKFGWSTTIRKNANYNGFLMISSSEPTFTPAFYQVLCAAFGCLVAEPAPPHSGVPRAAAAVVAPHTLGVQMVAFCCRNRLFFLTLSGFHHGCCCSLGVTTLSLPLQLPARWLLLLLRALTSCCDDGQYESSLPLVGALCQLLARCLAWSHCTVWCRPLVSAPSIPPRAECRSPRGVGNSPSGFPRHAAGTGGGNRGVRTPA